MKSTKPLVSVIVSNYNGKKYLKACFDSLLAQTYPSVELVFADDGSTDGSVEFMAQKYPQVIRAVNPQNAGLSVTSNNGAKKALGKYLLFYNNDTIAFPDFIEEMVKVIKRGKNIGVVCPVQLPYRPEDDAAMTEDQKDIGVGSDIYGYICTASDAGHIFYPDAAIFIKTDLFKKIGGFDPDFRLYGEDMDICWRVHLMGKKIGVAKKAKFRHDSFCAMRDDTGKIVTSYKRRYLVERQVINKLFKYYELSTLLGLFPKFVFFYVAEALFFLFLKANPKMFWEVYAKAVLWNIGKAASILKNRRYIQSIRKVDDKYILGLMYPRYRKFDAALRLGVPEIK